MLRQSHVKMTMHYVHNSRKARTAQGEFLAQFLPKAGAQAAVAESRSGEKREPMRVQ